MTSVFRLTILGGVLACLPCLTGCGSSGTAAPTTSAADHDDDHDHDAHGDHPDGTSASLAGAVSEVERLRGEIQAAFAAGQLEKADGPVHAIGHLLEDLPKLAATKSLSEADQQQVKRSVDALMNNFAALDERVHGGDSAGKSFDEVAAQIESALTELKSIGKE